MFELDVIKLKVYFFNYYCNNYVELFRFNLYIGDRVLDKEIENFFVFMEFLF